MTNNHLSDWINSSIKLGVALSFILIVIGLALLSIVGPIEIEAKLFLQQLPQEILKLNPTAIITLGIVLLLITPILQIVTAIVVFTKDRDKLFGGISLLLLGILIFSLALALI